MIEKPLTPTLRSDTGNRLPVRNNGQYRVEDVLIGPFPARVRGICSSGESFDTYTVLDNLSDNRLYLRLNQCIEAPVTLLIITQVYYAALALRGVVLSKELLPDNAFRLEIMITNHRFLRAA